MVSELLSKHTPYRSHVKIHYRPTITVLPTPIRGTRDFDHCSVFWWKKLWPLGKGRENDFERQKQARVYQWHMTKPEEKKDDSSQLQAWEMPNLMINMIDPMQWTSVAYIDPAKDMWDTLKKRYAISNVPRIHQLKMSIANCKQGGLSVVEFYSKISNLWMELEALDQNPACTYGGCKCKASNKIIQKYERHKAY